MEIGSRIRGRREALDLTQDELAREIGVTPQHVSRIEGGLNAPSLVLLVQFARVLGVTTDYLLTGEDPPAPDWKGAIRNVPGLDAKSKRLVIDLIGELSQPG